MKDLENKDKELAILDELTGAEGLSKLTDKSEWLLRKIDLNLELNRKSTAYDTFKIVEKLVARCNAHDPKTPELKKAVDQFKPQFDEIDKQLK